MRPSNPTRKLAFGSDLSYELTDEQQAMLDHLNRTATPGLAYGISTIFEELAKHVLITSSADDLCSLGIVMDTLILEHNWRQCGSWGYFFLAGEATRETTIKDVILYCIPNGGSFDIQIICKSVGKVYDEIPEAATVRKAMQRLVKDSHFMRVDRGVYQKTHRGF